MGKSESYPILDETQTFTDCSLQQETVYGPVWSRRLGCSLGINPLPYSYKLCDFDCVYCQYGRTPVSSLSSEKIKSLPVLLEEIERGLRHHRLIGTPVESITLAGNGEPTLYPAFYQFVRGLLALRDTYFPKVKVGILSDASQIHRPEIKRALMLLDDRCMKLDAGKPELLHQINRPRGNFDFNRLVQALKDLPDIIIQSLFFTGSFNNIHPEHLEAWIEQLSFIRPKGVQVYSIDRHPADRSLRKVGRQKLEEIAIFCRRKTGIPASVFA